MKFKEKRISDIPVRTSLETCPPSMLIRDVIIMLKKNNIGSVVIMNSGSPKPVGIFTERDYLRKIAGEEANYLDSPVEHFMTANPKTVKESDGVYKALFAMRLGRFRHVVVTDEDGVTTTGVVSQRDLMDFLTDYLESDTEI